MNSFNPTLRSKLKLSEATVWLIGACMEAKGKQDLWLQQKPESLDALRQLAIIQSAESSNRIEGVTVVPDRLRPIVLGEVDPRERSEEELLGYRKALDWIHRSFESIEVSPENIQNLHKICQHGFTGDAGKWKSPNNEIIEILPNGERRIRFVPVEAKKTPQALRQLCLAYKDTSSQDQYLPLVNIAALVFDFLCIHPFRDGNGRVARLLMLLTLRQQGYHVGSYISLERIIEESKDGYYETLSKSSAGWHKVKHDLTPWLNYFLSTVRMAYSELEKRFEKMDAVGKSGLVKQTILRQTSPFSLAQIKAQCPSVSIQTVKKVLSELHKENKLVLEGKGRGAIWKVRK